jgi:hypothetical protein
MGRMSTICSRENGHGMQGRPLQRSLSDGPLLVLCILPCVDDIRHYRRLSNANAKRPRIARATIAMAITRGTRTSQPCQE